MNTPTRLASLATLAIVPATAAFAQISVDPGITVAMGSQPGGAVLADLNGDGHADLATTVDGPDRIQTALNDGAGNFLPGPAAFLGSSSSPQDLVAGDFDGDGLVDLAVAVRDPSGAVLIMRNSGGANFVLAQTVSVGSRPRGLDAADFDGDGDIDLACVARDGNSVHVLTNVGGGFSAAALAAGNEPRKAAFGDFDGDGDLDLAVTNHDDRTVSTYTNSAGSFTMTATIPVGGIFRPEGIDAADLDADGDADLVVALSDQTVANVVGVLTSSAGTFTGPAVYATGDSESGQVALADFDGDGFVDAAVSNKNSGTVSILAGAAGNAFGAPMMMNAGVSPEEIGLGDLDGDGDLDIAVANRDSGTVSVFRNSGEGGGGDPDPLPCPYDVDADGAVDFDDLVGLLSAWGPCPTTG